MPVTPPAVGASIDARCTKCRKNASHTILSLSGDSVDKVQCPHCSRQHAFRPPLAASTPTARRSTPPGEADRNEWQRLRPGMKSSLARTYSMNDAYKVKNLVEHPLFGLGLVQRIVGPHKVEILFADGKKTMRCR